jgi:hypothetical protein
VSFAGRGVSMRESRPAVERFLDDDFERMWAAGLQKVEAPAIPGMIESILGSVGVLSLTENPSDNVMWGHYGDKGRGVVFEFNTADQFFAFGQNSGNALYGLRKVVYSITRPEVPHMGDTDATWRKLLFTKPDRWRYESEWRLPRFLVDGDPSASDPEVVLFDLPSTAVAGIILGPKMDKGDCDAIIRDIADDPALRHVRISRAFLSHATYDLEIIPVDH